jgi:LPS sulfotransferase NodH
MVEADKQADKSQDIRKTIIVVTDTRAGSNYLCALMSTTGKLGNPEEYFSPQVAFGDAVTISDRCNVAKTQGSTPNGITAIKIFAYHWQWLHKEIKFSDVFPNRYWIWLRRRDFLAQAISRAIALQTEAWISTTVPTASPVYSSEQIMRTLRYIAKAEARWQMFFARNRISPLTLWYEDFISAPVETIMQISDYVEVEIQPTDINMDVHTRIQRTTLNEKWKEKFISEMGSIDYLDQLISGKSYPRSFRNLWRFLAGKLPAPN